MNGQYLSCGCQVGSHWCLTHINGNRPWDFKDGEVVVQEFDGEDDEEEEDGYRFWDKYKNRGCTCFISPPCNWCIDGYCDKHDEHCNSCGCNPIIG